LQNAYFYKSACRIARAALSKRSNKDKGRLAPFVPLLIETLDCPAWKAMSMGARVLYAALKRKYGVAIHNNGRLYLSQRDAVAEIGSHRDQIARWYRELQHYGFIVMTDPGCLGVDGRGNAPHWRLTELGYMKDPPTRDLCGGSRVISSLTKNRIPAWKSGPGWTGKPGQWWTGKPGQ
jgi:hypothetical protein